MKTVDETLKWVTLNALARIHDVPRKQRVKGGGWRRRTKAEVAKDIRRAMAGTFRDRMRRSWAILASVNWFSS